MILVAGATGTIGRRLILELRIRQSPFRILTRDPAKARTLLGHVDAIVGDYFQDTVLARALADVDAAFLLSPVDPNIPQWESMFARAAKKAGVKRVVKLSALGADPTSCAALLRWHGEAEEEVRRAGVPFVMLRPSAFFQNLEQHAPGIRRGVLAAPMAQCRIAMLDADDVAAAAAAALNSPALEGQTLTLTGPEALTYADIAARLSALLGRPVSYSPAQPKDAEFAMLKSGMPAWLVDALLGLAEQFRSGRAELVTQGVHTATGRQPRSISDYFRDRRSAFC